MRTMIVGATFLVFGAGAAAVGALDNIALQGSDTLEQVTKDVLAVCPNATAHGITYNGGGSTTGETAMGNGTQTVAPMSRFLNPTAPTCTNGATAQGIVVGLDGIAIVSNNVEGSACGSGLAFSTSKSFNVTVGGDPAGAAVVNCTGCDAGTNIYHLTDWKDVLKLVFAGAPHTGATDCSGDVRRSLVNQWGALFETGCSGGTCTQLKHAFRRSDLSGTTDTLLAALGLPGLASPRTVVGATAKANAYCNAFGLGNIFGGDSDYQDKDPIRRACDLNEQVCQKDGTLGLIMVTEVPADFSGPISYATTFCDVGKYRLMKPAAGVTTCPNGGGLLIGKCFHPYHDLGGGAFNPHCLYRRGTPVQGIAANGMDGRSYNLIAKLNQTFPDNTSVVYAKDNLNRTVTGAFYRVHTTLTTAAGAATCQQTSSTDQIGCLVAASPCSIGYAGREADLQPGSLALKVNGITDAQANIEKLVTAPTDPTIYPLSRKLFFNTMVGFDSPTMATGELELAKCMAKNSIVNPIITSRGFIDVPGGLICQDFKEETPAPGCASASPVDACAVHGGNALITP